MTERVVFIGPIKQDSKPFIKSAGFECTEDFLPNQSPAQRLLLLFTEYSHRKNEITPAGKPQPQLWIIEDEPEELLKASNRMRETALGSKQQEEYTEFFKSLVVVKLGASIHSDTVDKETGIRVVGLKKGQSAFPMHPTPAH